MDPAAFLAMGVSSASPVSGVVELFSNITTDLDPSQVAGVGIPAVLEYVALTTGAISGALKASEHDLDIIGATTLAMVTGLGGGLLRDIILPTSSIYMLDSPVAILVCFFFGALAFFFSSIFTRMNTMGVYIWVDALSIAAFTAVGAEKALSMGYNPLACTLMGVITAVGGGMIRDICLGVVPGIFRRGQYYAVAAIGGAAAYVVLVEIHLIKPVALLFCVVLTLALRMVSIKYNLQTKGPVDYSSKVTRPLKDAWSSLQGVRRKTALQTKSRRLVLNDLSQAAGAGVAVDPKEAESLASQLDLLAIPVSALENPAAVTDNGIENSVDTGAVIYMRKPGVALQPSGSSRDGGATAPRRRMLKHKKLGGKGPGVKTLTPATAATGSAGESGATGADGGPATTTALALPLPPHHSLTLLQKYQEKQRRQQRSGGSSGGSSAGNGSGSSSSSDSSSSGGRGSGGD